MDIIAKGFDASRVHLACSFFNEGNWNYCLETINQLKEPKYRNHPKILDMEFFCHRHLEQWDEVYEVLKKAIKHCNKFNLFRLIRLAIILGFAKLVILGEDDDGSST